MNDLYRTIHLFRQFPKYDKLSYEFLVKMVTPSINLDQYQIHRIGNQDVGFTNWAFLSDNVEQRFLFTKKLKDNEWKCGNNIWVMNVLAKSNCLQIMKWVKNYFRDMIEVNESVKWVREDNNFHIYRKAEKFKREFHV